MLLHVLLANRNAWHSTTSQRYDGAEGLYLRLKSAKQAAEDLRKPGTWFSILEVPGLALRCEAGLVVTTDHHSRTPMGRWRPTSTPPALRIGTPIRQVIHDLGPNAPWAWNINDDSFITGTVRDLFVQDLKDSTFRIWDSSSAGSKYYLNWTSSEYSFQLDGIESICEAFASEHGGDDIAAATNRYFEARDAEYAQLSRTFRFPRPSWAHSA